MKRLLLVLLCFLGVATTYAQDYKVRNNDVMIERIIENTGMSVQQAHDKMMAVLVNVFNDSNKTLRLDQPDHIIYKGIMPDLAYQGMGSFSLLADMYVDVAIKENRMRIQVYANNIFDNGRNFSYNITELAPINEAHDTWRCPITKKTANTMFNNLVAKMYNLALSLEKSLAQPLKNDDNW